MKADHTEWHIITGEYPPAIGGVGDYTVVVSEALSARGVRIHVWCSGRTGESVMAPDIKVHGIGPTFGIRAMRRLGSSIKNDGAVIVLQYTPHAYGFRAMNVWLCFWMLWRALWFRQFLIVMFHEVALPYTRGLFARNIVAAVQRLMAWCLVRAADSIFVSTPAWTPVLEDIARRKLYPLWAPVPSNIPPAQSAAVTELRARILDGEKADAIIVGHFGTCGPAIESLLRPVICRLIREDERLHILLIGRDGDDLRRKLVQEEGAPGVRVTATGELGPDAIATHMGACDLAVQPYPDGITTRRTSAMAWLANGVALITNEGQLTEPLWRESNAVALADAADPLAVSSVVMSLARDPTQRSRLSEVGRTMYASRFAPRNTADALLRVVRQQ